MTADNRTLMEIAAELKSSGMQCNCDLDNWGPERTSGHSWVCRIHKSAVDVKAGRYNVSNALRLWRTETACANAGFAAGVEAAALSAFMRRYKATEEADVTLLLRQLDGVSTEELRRDCVRVWRHQMLQVGHNEGYVALRQLSPTPDAPDVAAAVAAERERAGRIIAGKSYVDWMCVTGGLALRKQTELINAVLNESAAIRSPEGGKNG